MRDIEIKVLNAATIKDAEQTAVAMARMTQQGEKITDMLAFEELLSKPYTQTLVENLVQLPHNTLWQFDMIKIAIIGASRRFLTQATRRRVGVTFMSGSLQYSDYSDKAKFTIPYAITELDKEHPKETAYGIDKKWHEKQYINSCEQSLAEYEAAICSGLDHDAAGYMMPQGLRNVLLISASPQAWIEMIRQRTCNRNTLETQFVFLRCWEELYNASAMFQRCGPACIYSYCYCPEGSMCCGKPVFWKHPTDILNEKFKHIRSV